MSEWEIMALEEAHGKPVFSSQALLPGPGLELFFFFHILCTHWDLSGPQGRRNLFPLSSNHSGVLLSWQKADDYVGIWGLLIEAV